MGKPSKRISAPPDSARPELVVRGLRAIYSGWCDGAGVEPLAPALGVESDVLEAAFEASLGRSPGSLQRSRIALVARGLLEHTDLSVAKIARGMGLRTGEVGPLIADAFDSAPGELRAKRRAADAQRAGDAAPGLILPVPHSPTVDTATTMSYLKSRAIPGIESVEGERYVRSASSSSGSTGRVEIEAVGADTIELRLPDASAFSGTGDLLALVTWCRRLFALDEPLAADAEGLCADPVLGPLVEANPGLRLAGAWDPFETAIRIVVGQQVTVAAASTLAGRLVDRFGAITPGPLATADLTGMGMPASRARTISNLAAAVLDGSVALDGVAPLKQSIAELTAVVGIGPWTAELIAARVLRHADAFPPKDLGLRRSYAALGGNVPVEEAAEKWRPHRAASIAYLWFAESLVTESSVIE